MRLTVCVYVTDRYSIAATYWVRPRLIVACGSRRKNSSEPDFTTMPIIHIVGIPLLHGRKTPRRFL
jgi:hypothetical protein